MIRRGYTKYPLFPKGNHCPAAAKVFNTTTEDYRVGHTPWLTYINPHMPPWNSVQQFCSPKSITDLSDAHYCLSSSKTVSFCEFSFPSGSIQCTLFRTIPPTTLQSSLLDLISVLQKMALLALRVCQVTDGASMGPRDVITMVYRGFIQPNLQAGTAFNHEASTQSWTSVTWVPCDPFSPSSPS